MYSIDNLIDHYREHDMVSGASYCASVRRGFDDDMSDIDLWVFLRPDTDLSSNMVWAKLIPAELANAGLEEGRDDHWADYVVLNLLVEGRILNLKFLRMELLSDFCAVMPSWDLDYMENLENYWTMRVVIDKDGQLASHKAWLENYALRKVAEVLVPELLRRYAIHYWRSVYQGVLRDEVLNWTNQIFYLAELLVTLAHLNQDRLPPCKKWILASPTLRDLGEVGELTTRLLHLARATDIADKAQVMAVYGLFAEIEDKTIDLEVAGWEDHWWRRVLDQRMNNHHIDAELAKIIKSAMGHRVRDLSEAAAS